MDPDFNPNLIIPIGTQVVSRVEIKGPAGEPACPPGAVGEIIEAPVDNFHSYRVRFVNGVEASLRRQEISIRKQYQQERAGEILSEFSLYDYVIYRCIVGSRAFGLDESGSDTDRRGIYLPPAEMQWSLYGVPEQLENADREE